MSTAAGRCTAVATAIVLMSVSGLTLSGCMSSGDGMMKKDDGMMMKKDDKTMDKK